jgi:hypothetical protein
METKMNKEGWIKTKNNEGTENGQRKTKINKGMQINESKRNKRKK